MLGELLGEIRAVSRAVQALAARVADQGQVNELHARIRSLETELGARTGEINLLRADAAVRSVRECTSAFRGVDFQAVTMEVVTTLFGQVASVEDTSRTPHSADKLITFPFCPRGDAGVRILIDDKNLKQKSVQSAHLEKLARDVEARGADLGLLLYSELPTKYGNVADLFDHPERGEALDPARFVACTREGLPAAVALLLVRHFSSDERHRAMFGRELQAMGEYVNATEALVSPILKALPANREYAELTRSVGAARAFMARARVVDGRQDEGALRNPSKRAHV